MTNTAESAVSESAIRALIALRRCGTARQRLVDLIRRGQDFDGLREAELRESGLHDLFLAWGSDVERTRAREELQAWSEEGIAAIPLGSKRYPELVRVIADPPIVLFVQGGPIEDVFQRPALGVVGSRRGDAIGCGFASDVSCEFARRGGVVVSGLAVGIDGAAHRGALAAEQRGATIAVLGSGHHMLYPAMHRPLARDILATGGLIVSQFEPGTKPFPANFLNRNRVIAGLSLAVLVVQAATRSGALVTARAALDEGREVFVVPGGITDPLFGGSNRLLRAGATPITELADVFESFPAELAPPVIENPSLEGSAESRTRTGEEERVLAALQSGAPEHLDTLVQRVGGELHGALLELELEGEIVRLPGNYVQRVAANGRKARGL